MHFLFFSFQFLLFFSCPYQQKEKEGLLPVRSCPYQQKEKGKGKEGLLPARGLSILKADRRGGATPASTEQNRTEVYCP